MSVEYRVRPVARFSVTRFQSAGRAVGSSVIGEFPNGALAREVAEAMAASEGGVAHANVLPAHDIPAMLRNIAEVSETAVRGLVVTVGPKGEVDTYGLGAKTGDPRDLLKAAEAELLRCGAITPEKRQYVIVERSFDPIATAFYAETAEKAEKLCADLSAKHGKEFRVFSAVKDG